MGLTFYYDWKARIDAPTVRRLIKRFRGLEIKLPFEKVSEIHEQNSPDGEPTFLLYDHPFRQGCLYLPRKRADGEEELVDVPALHAMFFSVYVTGRRRQRSAWPAIRLPSVCRNS